MDEAGTRAAIRELVAIFSWDGNETPAREADEIRTAGRAEEALAERAESPAAIALVDLRMPEMDGLEVLRFLRKRAPNMDVITMTAYEDLPAVATAMREGAMDFLIKPLDLHHLSRLLARIFEDRETREATRPNRLRTRGRSAAWWDGTRPWRSVVGAALVEVVLRDGIGIGEHRDERARRLPFNLLRGSFR